jgi:hypothetical protein
MTSGVLQMSILESTIARGQINSYLTYVSAKKFKVLGRWIKGN